MEMLQLVSCDTCSQQIPSCASHTHCIPVPSVFLYHAECLGNIPLSDSKLL